MICCYDDDWLIGHVLVIHEIIFVWVEIASIEEDEAWWPQEEVYLDVIVELVICIILLSG